MIVELPDTTTSAISKALVKVREEGGVVALGRVLTLVIASAGAIDEEAIEAANDASREHPMRVIVLSTGPGEPRLDAEIRVGGDAGASEVVVLRASGEAAADPESLVTGLLLPDAPVVVWWPGEAPEDPHASPLGRIAHRRITDAAAAHDPGRRARPSRVATTPRATPTSPGPRLTLWRAQLATTLDQPPYETVRSARVTGSSDSPSTELLAAWLRLALRVDVALTVKQPGDGPNGIHFVELERESGVIRLSRDAGGVAVLTQPGQPLHEIALPRRSLRDCLAEELRRLDPDELFGEVVRTEGSRV